MNALLITQVLATLDYESTGLFHFTGLYHSTPNCPIKLELDFNPSGVASYKRSDYRCSKPASFNVPFFVERPGPRYELITLAAHEGRPGHHTQVTSEVYFHNWYYSIRAK